MSETKTDDAKLAEIRANRQPETLAEVVERFKRLAAMEDPADVLVCDTCGACWPNDAASDLESCSVCCRFKQRMEWAKAGDVAKDALSHLAAAQKELAKQNRELDAAVQHHSRYVDKIDLALGEPRQDGCDILTAHLNAIAKLKANLAAEERLASQQSAPTARRINHQKASDVSDPDLTDYCACCGDVVPVYTERHCDGTNFVCSVCGKSTDYVFDDE